MGRRKSQKREKLNLVWKVIYDDVNRNCIDTFNVFDHWRFEEDVQKFLKEYDTKESFAERLERSVMYYFWCKSEWEVIVVPLREGRKPYQRRIDVAWQLLNNWDAFVNYVWNAKPQKKTYAANMNTGDNSERNREVL